MPPSSGITVKNERVGVVDWSESGYSDETLFQRIDDHLPKLFDKLNLEANAECSVNLAGNRLRGPEPIAALLRALREAKVQVITLRLHKNQLSDEAMQSIVEHIKHSTKEGRPLLELHLSDNRLTEVGVRNLVQAAHRCRWYFSANSSPERRCRALWLRCENQRPPISEPHALLDRLSSDGLNVCLLPSKEYQPPSGGRAKQHQMEAPVHMHHAFAPRSEHRVSNEAWVRDKGGSSGGGKSGRDWWTSSDGKGKDGGKDGGKYDGKHDGKDGKDGKGKGYGQSKSSAQENGHNSRAKSFANYEDHKGKGKAIAESWRNAENYASNKMQRHSGPHAEDSSDWKDWGYDDDDWDDAPAGNYGGRVETHKFELGRASGSMRGERSEARSSGLRSSASAWGADQRHNSQPGSSSSAAMPGMAGQGQHGGLPSYPIGPCQGQPSGYGGTNGAGAMHAGFWDGTAGMWIGGAVESVRWKITACKKLGLLSRSLNPNTLPESEWKAVATLGAQQIAQACTQRSSVVVGSFIEDAGLYELSTSCAGECNLAIIFRQLRLASVFAVGAVQDEQNDSQCASCLAALFGELIDAPMSGESTHKENARKVAEWALLDFIFLVGTGRLMSACLMSMGSANIGGGRY